MRLRIAALSSLLFLAVLAGCALFVPAYDPLLDEKTTAAYEEISRLLADVNLGNLADKGTYGDGSRYSNIEAKLAVASMRAQALPVTEYGTSAKQRDNLAAMIDNCRFSVRNLAVMHKKDGIPPDVGAAQPVMATCDMAVRAVQMMK